MSNDQRSSCQLAGLARRRIGGFRPGTAVHYLSQLGKCGVGMEMLLIDLHGWASRSGTGCCDHQKAATATSDYSQFLVMRL